MKTKIIAMYLPQYHRIPENDLWWGNGYTDWVAVKNARALYEGHNQPRVPYNGKYYDLSDVTVIKAQADLATQYGIYGFGMYHYWFSSNQVLLDKPATLILNNKDVNIHYFFMWDNGSWKRTWSNVKFSNSWAPLYENNKEGPEILARMDYGGEDEWEKHFNYLLPFFNDERYIKIDGKPLFGIFNQNNDSETLGKMFVLWNKCALKCGLNGVAILGKTNTSKKTVAEYQFDYEPATHGWVGKNNVQKVIWRIKDKIRVNCGLIKRYKYLTVWRRILNDISYDEKYFSGAFVRYDDTPRRGNKGSIVIGDNVKSFENNMIELLRKTQKMNKKFVFLTAWNEWGEGAYLEPDEENGYAYLEALKSAIESVSEKK